MSAVTLFVSTAFNATKLSFDSKKVRVDLPYRSAAVPPAADPTLLLKSFLRLEITVSDLATPSNAPLRLVYSPSDVIEFLESNTVTNSLGDVAFTQNARTAYSVYFEPKFNGKLSSRIQLNVSECGQAPSGSNSSDTYDWDSASLVMDIPLAPDAPKVEVQTAFKYELDADSKLRIVSSTGSLKITSSSQQSITHYRVIATGNNDLASNSGFSFTGNLVAYSPTLSLPSVLIDAGGFINSSLGSSKGLKADSNVTVYVQVLGNDLFSELSLPLIIKPSIRLPKPEISAVTSLMDEQIKVSGSYMQASYFTLPAAEKRVKLSVLAVLVGTNEVVDASLGWALTDIKNIDIKGTKDNVTPPTTETFSYNVTKVNNSLGVQSSLVNAVGYRFTAVLHIGDYVESKSLDIYASSNPPKLSQSEPSNMDKTGLCVKYVPASVKWNVTYQTFTESSSVVSTATPFGPVNISDSELTFVPSFDNAGQLPSAAQMMQIQYQFSSSKKNFVPRSHLAEGTVTAVYTSNNFWVVENPIPNDTYTLTASPRVFLTNFHRNSIQGATPLEVVVDANNHYSVVLKTFVAENITQTRRPSEVPALREFYLDTVKLSATSSRQLVTSHKAPTSASLAEAKFKIEKYEYEVIAAPSSNPADFVITNRLALTSNGDKTATSVAVSASNSSYSDHPEVKLLTIYNNGAAVNLLDNTIYSARVRAVAKDLSSGQTVSGNWLYASHQLVAEKMIAAKSVMIANHAKLNKQAFEVTIVVDKQINVNTNKPANWGAASRVIPYSARVHLLDENGENLATYERAFTANELFAYDGVNVPGVTPSPVYGEKDLTAVFIVEPAREVQANSAIYAKVWINYASSSSPSLRKEGSHNDTDLTIFIVRPEIQITLTKIVQNPELAGASGERQASDSSGMVNFRVYANVQLNKLPANSAAIRCFVASASTPNTPAEGGGYIMTVDSSDPSGETYVTAALTPSSGTNYATTPVFAYATHPGSRNIFAVDFL